MRRIPKAVTIGSHRFTIELLTEDELRRQADDTDCYGLFLPQSLRILLEKPSRKLKRSIVIETLWHELAHATLWVMGHRDYTNERVVTQLGHFLKQIIDTAEYE